MKKIVPANNTVLCVNIVPEHEILKAGNFEYVKDHLPLYRIEASSLVSDEFKTGDVIAVNSTGTKFKSEGVEYYIFKFENIAAKVVD